MKPGNMKNEDELIARKLSGDLSEEEIEIVNRKLLTDGEFRQKLHFYREIWERSAEITTPKGLTTEERWKKLDASLTTDQRKAFSPYLKYAAVIALLIATVAALFQIIFTPEQMLFTTANGEIKEIELPDHSIITLNANSDITYIPSDFREKRIVKLNGEAYFEIRKSDIPFIVQTNKAKVEVLGTTFNVRTFDQKVRVACATGKVRVSISDEQSRVLTRGQGVKVVGHEISNVFDVDADNIAVWKEGRLYFREAPLKEVLAEMQRYFDVEITVDKKVENLTFTGKFDNPQLEDMLKTICLSAGLDYELPNKKVVRIK